MINSIKINGKGLYNYLWVVDGGFTSTDISNMKNKCYEPDWDRKTLLLAKFDYNLIAGNIDFVPEDLSQWAVYRLETGSSELKLAAIIPENNNAFTDFNVKNNTEYTYYIYPETTSNIGSPIISQPITTSWTSWSLSTLSSLSVDGQYKVDDIFNIDFNVSSEGLNTNSDSTIFKNFTKYPKVHKSKSFFMSGQLTFIEGYISDTGEMMDNATLMKKIGELSNDGKKKILKDRKGNAWLVDLISSTQYVLDGRNEIQPIQVTFNWAEIGDIEEISVYETYRNYIWVLEDVTQTDETSLWTSNTYDLWNSNATWHT